MPRTRTDVQRDAKRAEILDAAERALTAAGYGGLSVVGVARELGVAQNSVHWYFPTKDELFVAVLRRRVERVLTAKPRKPLAWPEQIVWFVDRLATHQQLITAMRERAAHAHVVRQFADEFDEGLTTLTTGALKPHIRDETLPHAVCLVLSTVDGLLLRGTAAAERDTVMRLLLQCLAAQTPSDGPEGCGT